MIMRESKLGGRYSNEIDSRFFFFGVENMDQETCTIEWTTSPPLNKER
jgi:hypothetical protein